MSIDNINNSKILEKIKETTNNRIEKIDLSSNPMHKTFKATFIDENLGDVTIPIIFKYIYDENTIYETETENQTFILTMLKERKDYDIKFEKPNMEPIPEYYLNPQFSTDLFRNLDTEKLKKLFEDSQEFPLFTDCHYYFTHPLKPVFMGPDKVNVHEHYKFHLVSPLCLIVEIFSYCSGFMLMDTFYTVIQYKYDSEPVLEEGSKQLHFKTRLTISYSLEFVKANIFKSRVESESLKDNEQVLKEFWFPKIKIALEKVNKNNNQTILVKPIEPIEEINNLDKIKKEEVKKTEDLTKCVEKSEVKTEFQNDFRIVNLIFNKYGLILLGLFMILVLGKIDITNSLAVVLLLGFGIVIYKLDVIDTRLRFIESRSK